MKHEDVMLILRAVLTSIPGTAAPYIKEGLELIDWIRSTGLSVEDTKKILDEASAEAQKIADDWK